MPINTAVLEHTFAADGNSAAAEWNPEQQGPRGMCIVDPTTNDFGTGTVTVQWSPTDPADSATWFTNTGVSISAASPNADNFEIPPGWIRINLASSSSPDITVHIFKQRL